MLTRCLFAITLTGAAIGCQEFSSTEPADSAPGQQAEPVVQSQVMAAKSAEKPAPATADPLADKQPAAPPREPAAPREPTLPPPVAYVAAAGVPQVYLSAQHRALAQLRVGDPMPEIVLPNLDGEQTALADLLGERATVVVFWKPNRQMARDELADLQPDVIEPYASQGVAVVGIAVEQSPGDARNTLNEAGAAMPTLIDGDGQALAQVGRKKLPWTLVLDADGTIVWFDMEYSLATRRELQQAIEAIN